MATETRLTDAQVSEDVLARVQKLNAEAEDLLADLHQDGYGESQTASDVALVVRTLYKIEGRVVEAHLG
jgi:hypothetical protein